MNKKMSKEEIIKKLQYMLDECLEYNNQEGTLWIADLTIDEDDQGGTGVINFTWSMCENQPYFRGY